MVKAYIAGALTNLPEDENGPQKLFYEAMADVCRELKIEGYVPHLYPDPDVHSNMTPREVWETDAEAIRSSQILIADVTHPSHGVGGELEMAREEGVQIILLHQSQIHVSRYPRGNPAVEYIIAYKDYDEAYRILRGILPTILNRLRAFDIADDALRASH